MGSVVVGVDHVQLAMPAGREPEARAFYSGRPRIPEITKPPALAARGGAWFEAERLRRAGYAIVDDEPLEGYLRVYVSDPFGNRLELMERRG